MKSLVAPALVDTGARNRDFESDEEEHNESDAAETEQCKQIYYCKNGVDKTLRRSESDCSRRRAHWAGLHLE